MKEFQRILPGFRTALGVPSKVIGIPAEALIPDGRTWKFNSKTGKTVLLDIPPASMGEYPVLQEKAKKHHRSRAQRKTDYLPAEQVYGDDVLNAIEAAWKQKN